MIINKLGSNNVLTNFIAYISGTIGGPIISFFKKNGFCNCSWDIGICIFI